MKASNIVKPPNQLKPWQLCSLLTLAAVLCSQASIPVIWQTPINWTTRSEISRIKLTPDGNNLIVFHYNGYVAGVPGQVQQVELAAGKIVWSNTVTKSGQRIFASGWVDGNGNLLFGGSWACYSLWKYDALLSTQLCSYNCSSCPGFEYVFNILTDGANNTYLVGFTGSASGYGSRAVKVDSSCNSVWTSQTIHTTGKDQYTEGMALDPSGNLYVVGEDQPAGVYNGSRGRIIGHGSSNGASFLDIAVAETNSHATGIVCDAEDNSFCVGCSFNLFDSSGQPTGSEQSVIQKRDSFGNVLWEYRFPGLGIYLAGANALRLHTSDNFYVAFQQRVGALVYPAIAEFSPSGQLLWQDIIDMPGWSFLRAGIEATGDSILVGLTKAYLTSNSDNWTNTMVLKLQPKLNVSPGLSTVTVSPGVAPADGNSAITATATLRDIYNNPVPGKSVLFYCPGTPIIISQPANPTDASGQCSALLTANVPCTASVSAVDVTDAVAIEQFPSPTVQFTQQPLVLPNADLSNAIVALYNITSDDLIKGNPTFANIATNAGAYGDNFRAEMTADEVQVVIDLLVAACGMTDDAQKSALKQALSSFLEQAVGQIGSSVIEYDLRTWLALRSDGLSALGSKTAQNCAILQATLQQQEQTLFSAGIPALSAAQQTAWVSDLEARNYVGQSFCEILDERCRFLEALWTARSLPLPNQTSWSSFMEKFGLEAITALFCGPDVEDVVFTTADVANDLRNLNGDGMAYSASISVAAPCVQQASETFSNAATAYGDISLGMSPSTVIGQIGQMSDWEEGYNAFGFLPVFSVTNAYSLLYLTNTSSADATFEVFTDSSYSTSVYGVTIVNLPFISYASALIPANGYAQVRITYFNGQQGCKPDTNPTYNSIHVWVLGMNATGTFYIGEMFDNFNPTRITDNLNPGPGGGPKPEDTSPDIENPVTSYVVQNPSNQTYESHIVIVNPSGQNCSAIVTQAIPAGITVLTTDGVLSGATILWTNSLAVGDVADDTFTFTLGVNPGVSTNVPSPSVVYINQTTNQTSPFCSVVSGFNGLFPVQVLGVIPAGIPGTNTLMQLTVTNLTGLSQNGTLTISLTNSSGTQVTNLSQFFSVSGSGSSVLTYFLPGTLAPGQYSLSASLSINGGAGQVLAGAYTVPVAPLVLGVVSPSLWSADGLNLVLQGQVGSNCLIMASSDLSNWVTIQYFSITNSPYYFSDQSAPNYPVRFYRAIMP